MRFILSFIFIVFFNAFANSQSDSKKKEYTLVQNYKKDSLAIFVGKHFELIDNRWEKIPGFFDIILINYCKSPDTLTIDKSDGTYSDLNSINVNLIRLGKGGRKGVHFTLIIKEASNLGEHGDYAVTKTVNEIWDIGLKEKIFSTVSKYQYTGDYMDWDDSTSYSSSTNYFFEYDFVLSSKNEILIKNLKTKLDVSENRSTINESKFPYYCECMKPEQEEGLYVYKNGKYILLKNKTER